jgi:hypothetical protein
MRFAALRGGLLRGVPDLEPDDVGEAFGADVMVVWGTGERLPPTVAVRHPLE